MGSSWDRKWCKHQIRCKNLFPKHVLFPMQGALTLEGHEEMKASLGVRRSGFSLARGVMLDKACISPHL